MINNRRIFNLVEFRGKYQKHKRLFRLFCWVKQEGDDEQHSSLGKKIGSLFAIGDPGEVKVYAGDELMTKAWSPTIPYLGEQDGRREEECKRSKSRYPVPPQPPATSQSGF